METPIITLHQLSMRYSAEQDRIQFLFSSTEGAEHRVWLTRRFVKLMWKALMGIVERHPDMGAGFEPHVRDAVLGMQHQESVQSLNVTTTQTPTKSSETAEPDASPLLVTGCTSRMEKSGKAVSLELIIQGGDNIRFRLNKEILHSLFHLLIQSTIEVEWDLGLQVGDPHVVVDKQKPVVH
mgnify:CR=1 FL=1